MKELSAFIKEAARVVPSPRQLNWFEMGYYAFCHFTVNTYTGREWGLGNESESIFNPVELDCDQWVEAIKSAGMKGLILTAKHHDGFCLWQSKYTEHCMKNSPFKGGKGDIVKEASEACRRGGIKFGVYLSPWDRNSQYYGTPAYNDYYANQLTELLTNYGELFMVWQDNACGEGPNGKKQVYDFERFNALIRKYQPNATIFNDFGPDVRWCGNEDGTARKAEWAVVPTDMCFRSEEQVHGGVIDAPVTGLYNTDADIGCLSNILGAKGLAFTGSEIDMSIRPGWFYHPEEAPHSLERLFTTFLNSYGANASFNLNVPPMPNGKFDPRDIERLKELGEKIRSEFSSPVPCRFEKLSETEDGRCVVKITAEKAFLPRYVTLREDLTVGQRVESFEIRTGIGTAFRGLTVGNRKICPIELKEPTDTLYLVITSARDKVALREISLYE